MTKMNIAIVVAGCLISGVAAAAPKYDLNGDGSVDTQEKAQRRADMKQHRIERKQQLTAKFDANRDGKLGKQERVVMRNELATLAFKRLDVNRDGSITLAEFKQGKRFFKKHPRAARAMGGALKVR